MFRTLACQIDVGCLLGIDIKTKVTFSNLLDVIKNLKDVCPFSLTTIGPLLLFLVLGLGFFPSQGALIATIQPFSRSGLFNEHVSYAHMGLTLDFEPFREYLSSVKKTLQSEEYKRMESYGKLTFYRLLSCVEEIHGRHVEFENYFLGSPHHLSRPRRQLAALAGIGIGVLAMCDVATLRLTAGEMQSRQNVLVRQMECVTNDTIVLVKNFTKLKGAIEMMHQSELSLSHLLKIEATIIELSVFAERFFFCLSSLMDGKLSHDVVKSETAQSEFHSFQSAAFDKGYETVFRDFTQIFQLPASFIARKGSLLVIVDTPITPLADLGKFSLDRYHPMPFFYRGHLVKVNSMEHLLAVSKHREQFVPVSGADLHQCIHMGENFLCPFIGVRLTEEYQCCLCAIFLAQMKRIAKECELTFLRRRFHLERLNATLFVSFTNNSITGVSTCHGRQSQMSFIGLQHFTLPRTLSPLCSLQPSW